MKKSIGWRLKHAYRKSLDKRLPINKRMKYEGLVRHFKSMLDAEHRGLFKYVFNKEVRRYEQSR